MPIGRYPRPSHGWSNLIEPPAMTTQHLLLHVADESYLVTTRDLHLGIEL